jgi:hypothetical protein
MAPGQALNLSFAEPGDKNSYHPPAAAELIAAAYTFSTINRTDIVWLHLTGTHNNFSPSEAP